MNFRVLSASCIYLAGSFYQLLLQMSCSLLLLNLFGLCSDFGGDIILYVYSAFGSLLANLMLYIHQVAAQEEISKLQILSETQDQKIGQT